MDYSIKHQNKRKIAGFHMVGPWEQTVKQGFEQLVMWVDGRQIQPLEWVAVYYDNPDEVPAEKLRCGTAVTVPDDFVIPANSEGVILTEVAEGEYAVASARVENHDFATPWTLLFERYLNDGNADGYWDIEMFIPVQHRVS